MTTSGHSTFLRPAPGYDVVHTRHVGALCRESRLGSPRATRFEALEPIRQGVREHFGGFAKHVTRGLSVRHDHGSQYMSDAFQRELDFLGAESSPAFVRTPEGNGCAERCIRTLKENLMWVHSFDTSEELRQALHRSAKPITRTG